MRAAAPRASIWTIEQSKKNGNLHCNIITPTTTIWTPPRGHYWSTTITGDVRAVGAYISKRTQLPREADYTGNLYGKTGTIWEALTEQHAYPLIAAAATQYALDSHAMIQRAADLALSPSERNRRKWYTEEQIAKEQARPTLEQAREIAQKWLPDLLEFKRRAASK
jgi:hypothetical protein